MNFDYYHLRRRNFMIEESLKEQLLKENPLYKFISGSKPDYPWWTWMIAIVFMTLPAFLNYWIQ